MRKLLLTLFITCCSLVYADASAPIASVADPSTSNWCSGTQADMTSCHRNLYGASSISDDPKCSTIKSYFKDEGYQLGSIGRSYSKKEMDTQVYNQEFSFLIMQGMKYSNKSKNSNPDCFVN